MSCHLQALTEAQAQHQPYGLRAVSGLWWAAGPNSKLAAPLWSNQHVCLCTGSIPASGDVFQAPARLVLASGSSGGDAGIIIASQCAVRRIAAQYCCVQGCQC